MYLYQCSAVKIASFSSFSPAPMHCHLNQLEWEVQDSYYTDILLENLSQYFSYRPALQGSYRPLDPLCAVCTGLILTNSSLRIVFTFDKYFHSIWGHTRSQCFVLVSDVMFLFPTGPYNCHALNCISLMRSGLSCRLPSYHNQHGFPPRPASESNHIR